MRNAYILRMLAVASAMAMRTIASMTSALLKEHEHSSIPLIVGWSNPMSAMVACRTMHAVITASAIGIE